MRDSTQRFLPRKQNRIFFGFNRYQGSQSYNRARYYDSTTGEFCSRDPLEYIDGMSRYRGYFAPTDVDPLGLSTLHHWIPQQDDLRFLLNARCAEFFDLMGLSVAQISNWFVTPAGSLSKGGLHHCIQYRLGANYNKLFQEAILSSETCCEAFTNLLELIQTAWSACIGELGTFGPKRFPDLVGPFSTKKNLRPSNNFFREVIDFVCKPKCPPPQPPAPLLRPIPHPIPRPPNIRIPGMDEDPMVPAKPERPFRPPVYDGPHLPPPVFVPPIRVPTGPVLRPGFWLPIPIPSWMDPSTYGDPIA